MKTYYLVVRVPSMIGDKGHLCVITHGVYAHKKGAEDRLECMQRSHGAQYVLVEHELTQHQAVALDDEPRMRKQWEALEEKHNV